MNWFKHDTDATTDAKVKKLLIRYGVTGYAIYFHCLELIAGDISETNITFQLEHDSEIIADNLRIKGTAEKSGIAIVEEIMRYILDLGLFQERDNRIFCFKLLKRIDLSMTGKSAMRKMITQARTHHDAIMIKANGIMNREGECSEGKGSEKKRRVEKKPREDRATLTPYGEGLPVYISDSEKLKLENTYGSFETKDYIERVSTWQPKDGKRPANDYLTILNWMRRDKVPRKTTRPKCKTCGSELFDGGCRNLECVECPLHGGLNGLNAE